MNWVKNNASLLVWLIALAGTWLSVYCREILHIEPCPLCWYQRMAVFPIAMILGINLYRGDKKLVVYLVPFSFAGRFVRPGSPLFQQRDYFFRVPHFSHVKRDRIRFDGLTPISRK